MRVGDEEYRLVAQVAKRLGLGIPSLVVRAVACYRQRVKQAHGETAT